MTYEELLKMVAELRAQGKNPHGLLMDMLIDAQLREIEKK